jgi:hypothetical protein
VVAVIEPASAKFEEIFNDAMRLDTSEENQAAVTFGALERDEPFAGLVKLNPSLVRAIKLCARHVT